MSQNYLLWDLFRRQLNSSDGTKIPIEVGLNPIEISKGLFVLAAIVDVTERIQMEQNIRDKNALTEHRTAKIRELISKLTQAEQRERTRLAQILHDHLQQLLVAIKIRISRLSQINADATTENNIAEVVGLLEESINTTRTLAIELNPPVLRDAGLIAALEWLARWMMDKHELEVFIFSDIQIKNLPENTRIVLFQAVREFLFNVSRHAQTHQACIRINRRENEIHMVVEDQGKGFDPKIISQSSSSYFGLFQIWERLELFGCRMNVESAPGKGTRCSIVIPVEDSLSFEESDFEIVCHPEETPASPAPVAAEEMKIKLLVVDDHTVLRQCLIFALQDYPEIEVIGEASDGQEAVEKAMVLGPDVIVMDISMPRMTGIEATCKIKAAMPNVKIIGLSLHGSEDMAQPMLEAGASAYHCKSDPVDDLICSILNL